MRANVSRTTVIILSSISLESVHDNFDTRYDLSYFPSVNVFSPAHHERTVIKR